MKILDVNGTEIQNPNLDVGYLKDDIIAKHHDAIAEVKKVSHIEVVAEYPNGGKEVKEVVDIQPVIGQDAYDEQIPIQRYILYTDEELAEIKAKKEIPTILERLSALEDLALEMETKQ